jgi:methanogenic corrinoid protein MtbC1
VQTLLTARGLPDAALKRALGCLAKVVAAELPDDGGAPARSICEAAQRQLDSEPRDVSSFLRPDTMYGRLAAEYLLAVLEGDRLRASRLILDAATDPRTIRDLYLQVLLPAQAEVGRMWQVNEINVAEEHFASATTKSVLAQLRLKTAPLPANGKAAITAAVEGNHHDIGLQAVADFLEMAGWRVIQLSSDVPIPDLVQAVDSYAADLLALSVSLRSQLPALQRTIEAVRRGPRGAAVRILVGGRALTAADDLARQYGADACGVDPASAVALSNSLVGVDGGMAGA